jgi:hypothetical protein
MFAGDALNPFASAAHDDAAILVATGCVSDLNAMQARCRPRVEVLRPAAEKTLPP